VDFPQVVEELVFPQECLVAELTAEGCGGAVHRVDVPLLFVLAVEGFEAAGEITGYAAGECYALFTSYKWKVKGRDLPCARFE
jgi:hypothetical protein